MGQGIVNIRLRATICSEKRWVQRHSFMIDLLIFVNKWSLPCIRTNLIRVVICCLLYVVCHWILFEVSVHECTEFSLFIHILELWYYSFFFLFRHFIKNIRFTEYVTCATSYSSFCRTPSYGSVNVKRERIYLWQFS